MEKILKGYVFRMYQKEEQKILIEKYEKKIKGLQKCLSRSQKESKNREKIKIKLLRVYQKYKN